MKRKEKKKRGIFIKVFAYTLLFLFLMIAITGVFFSRQFLSFYESGQAEQLAKIFEPVLDQIAGKSPEEIAAIAKAFHEKNMSFRFHIEDAGGRIIYSTLSDPDTDAPLPITPSDPGRNLRDRNLRDRNSRGQNLLSVFKIARGDDQYILRSANSLPDPVDYGGLIRKILLALAIMFALCTLGAVFFAREITRPIMKLAADTKRMAKLEKVPAPLSRNDEIGQLAGDIYTMYGSLQRTIADLEEEIVRERAMEENQRVFFSAASHEFKTPIAATRALIEGMLANIGDYRDHRKYLRECLNMLDAQNRLVSEILEIVSLSEDRGAPSWEAADLGELLSPLLDEYEPIAEQRGQRILLEIPALRVRVDRRLLGRALSNVLSNALQNSPPGEGIRIEAREREPGKLRLSVFNPKAQVEAETLNRLFEPFYRMDPVRNRNAGRSGLGLTIVRRALERMDIPFALENTGEGVVFWMDLPLD
jgi:two-component system sensor histidine kinase VanS